RMARLSLSADLELRGYRWRALNFINLPAGPGLHRLRSCGTLATDIRPCSCSMAACSSPRDLRLLVTRAHIPRARKISSPDAFGNPGCLAPWNKIVLPDGFRQDSCEIDGVTVFCGHTSAEGD